MQERFNILNELKQIGAVALITTDNKNHFFVPENYFDTLALNVLSIIFLNNLPLANPYTVPEKYFENLPGVILEKIKNKGLPGVSQENVYSVPEGYFSSFADNILKKIKSAAINSVQQELEEISPFLSKIPRTNVYSAPANYFNELDISQFTIAETKKNEAKIISIKKSRKWLNYAAAACVAAVLFAGSLFYLSKQPSESNNITLSNTDIQRQISLLSDDEINNYLEKINDIGVYTNIGTEDTQPQNLNIQNMLQNVSDEEIQQYLKEDPEGVGKQEGI